MSVHGLWLMYQLMMYNLYIMKIVRQQQPQDLARTQIYLTRQQTASLAFVCRRQGASKSEIIRQAIDRFLAIDLGQAKTSKASQLAALTGLWADRAEMADPTAYVKQLRAPRF
jgi:hypothetical protein